MVHWKKPTVSSQSWWSACFLVATVCASALLPTAARGQSFGYVHPTGAVFVPFHWSSAEEFPRDYFGNEQPQPPAGFTYRIQAGLNQRYRFVGNPWLGTIALTLNRMQMDSTQTAGVGSGDRIVWDWFYEPSPQEWTGSWSAIGPAAFAGADSLMFPGTVLRVVTGPDSGLIPNAYVTPYDTVPEHESWGFETSNLLVGPRPTMGTAWQPTLGNYESVVGVVLGGDDTFSTAIFHSSDPITVATWVPDGAIPGMSVWVRCGAAPSPTGGVGYFFSPSSSSTAGTNFRELGTCATNWFVSVVNTSANPHVFRMMVGTHRGEYHDVNVGISWNAPPAEFNAIRDAFRVAAWRLYGLTGGAIFIRSFRFFNNANTCDDSWETQNFACAGQSCRYCLQGCAISATHPIWDTIKLCNDGATTPHWYQRDIVAHETLHSFVHLRDEYSTGIPIYGYVNLCAHSLMGSVQDPSLPLCSPQTHRTTTERDCDIGNHPIQHSQSIAGPISYANGGTDWYPDYWSGFTTMGDGWTGLQTSGALSVSYPSSQTPDSYNFDDFWLHAALGQPH